MFQAHAADKQSDKENCVMNNYQSTVNETTYIIGASDTLSFRIHLKQIYKTDLFVVTFHKSLAIITANNGRDSWYENITTDALQIVHFNISNIEYDGEMSFTNIKIKDPSFKNNKLNFVHEKIVRYFGVLKIEVFGKHALCKTPEKVTFIQKVNEPIPLNVNQIQHFSINNMHAFIDFNNEYYFDLNDIAVINVTNLYYNTYRYNVTRYCVTKGFCSSIIFQYTPFYIYPSFNIIYKFNDETVMIDYFFITHRYHISKIITDTNDVMKKINLIHDNIINVTKEVYDSHMLVLVILVLFIVLILSGFYLIIRMWITPRSNMKI